MIEHVYLIPLIPLAASIIILLGAPEDPRSPMPFLGIAATGWCLFQSLAIFHGIAAGAVALPYTAQWNWFTFAAESGGKAFAYDMPIGVLIDGPAAMMLVVVTLVSFLVQIYSLSYMHDDPRFKRYYAYLSFFTASMLGLVVSSNLLVTFCCWELVGFSSYILIGFWFERPEPAYACKKAFITTKLGDLGLYVALLLIFVITRQVRVLLAPLYVLADAARSYAAGDLRVRVRIGHPEETAALAESFNSMADSLEHRTQDLERRVRELTSLQRMNEFIVHHGGLREVGRACLEAAVNGLGFDRGHLFWIETDKSRIVGECTYRKDAPSFDDGAILGQKISLESSDILAVTARNGTAIQVTDASKDQRCRDSALLEHWAPAFCLAPLAGRSGALGIVYVDHHLTGRPISDQQKRGLSLFCAEAGLAIENTQLWDAIVQSEARYRTAVENSPYAVVGLDQNLRITLWNRRAETLFGYQPTEAYGRTLAFLFEEQTYKLLARQVETTGSVRQAEITGQTRDGRRLDLTVSWSGQDAGPRSAREWFVVMEDETEKKRMRAQLLQAEKLSAVGNLIAGVAHELNNPLAAVTGFAELLRDLPLQTEEREDLRHLYHSALRCRDIVQGLLLFVRKEKTVRHKLSLNEITQATIALFEYRIVKTEGIDLEVSLDPQTPFVAGNFHSIQQILVNLISNSCDALKGRLGPRAIHLRTRRSPQNCELIVEDTGPGVPPELRDKIFDPFYTSKPVGTGTGLGLSVSRQLTAEHGGTLRYEEGAQGGAMFVLALPPCPEGIPAATPQLGLPPQIQGRRVLVVDDEPDLVVLMMRLLREDGCIAEAALEIEEARRKLGQGAFDLAIIDLDLGQARGTELLHAARRLDCAPDCIIVTGDVLNAPLAAEVDRLGAPLLAKPFLRTDFLWVERASLGERDRRNSPRGA